MLYTTVTQNTIFVRCHAFNLHVPFFFGIEGDIIHKPQIILLHNSLALSLLKKNPLPRGNSGSTTHAELSNTT